MLKPITVFSVVIAYAAALFAIAVFWEKISARKSFPRLRALIYTFSFSVYLTAWSLYGTVGEITRSGFLYLTIYFGPVCSAFLWWVFLRKLVQLKDKYKITNLADFVSTRYGKSLRVGVLASLIAASSGVPYLTLQLKSVSSSFSLLVHQSDVPIVPLDHTLSLVFTALMTLFAVLFGLRKIDPTERHPGMIAVIAVESVVKLGAIVTIGLFVTYGLFDGIGDLFARAERIPSAAPLAHAHEAPGFFSTWLAYILSSMFGVLFLPRQFHVTVVENSSERHILQAMWLFPLYMLAFVFFAMPIAIGGLAYGLPIALADFFVIGAPLASGHPALALLAFLGGFSASAAMFMIVLTTVSVMISNYLLRPIIDALMDFKALPRLARGALSRLQRSHLTIRYLSVAVIIFAAYVFLNIVGPTLSLVDIGIRAFAATAQLAPAVIGGLLWKRGSKTGALLGMAAGCMMWFYTLIIPTLETGGIIAPIGEPGPFGITWLSPTHLFNMRALDLIPHSVFWSLAANSFFYIMGSLVSGQTELEQTIAAEFDIRRRQPAQALSARSAGPTKIPLRPKIERINGVLTRYLPEDMAKRLLNASLDEAKIDGKQEGTIADCAALLSEVERRLGGAIGSASAHRAVQAANTLTDSELDELAAFYGKLLASLRLSPTELQQRINFYEEREALLVNHAAELQKRIDERDREITLRQLAEEAQARLTAILENTSDFVAMIDTQGHVIYLNEAARNRFAIKGDLLTLHLKIEDLHPPQAARIVREVAMPTALSAGLWRGDCRYRIQGDGEIETSLVMIAHKRPSGALHYFSSVARDISEQKRAEHEMRAARDAAESANKTKSEFLATISHELRTPLNGILGGTELLLSEPTTRDQLEFINLIKRNALSLASVIDDILSFTHLVATRTDLHIERFRLRTLVAGVADSLRAQASVKNIELTARVSEHVVDGFEADPGRIRQVLLNLVGNAIKFTPRGSVSIEVSEASDSRDQQDVRFEIVDTGIGIPTEARDRLFQPFTQVDSSLTRRFGGTGMGLAIARQLVEMMKGRIGVSARKTGEGSVFWFILPLKKTTGHEPAPGKTRETTEA